MQKGFALIILILVGMTASASAPKGIRRDTIHEIHGEKRIDPYYWYKERENPEVIKHLEAENAFTDSALSAKLQKTLFNEMRKRQSDSEVSVPYRLGSYQYFHRYPRGKEHPIYYRRKLGSKKPPQVLIDVNEIVKKTGHADCREPRVSPNGNFMAYACDLRGQQTFTIRFRNLLTNTDLSAVIENADPAMAWATDNQTVFATAQDEETLRSSKVLRLNIFDGGTPTVVYEEKDESFYLSLYQSISQKFIYVDCVSTKTRSVLYIPSNKPKAKFAEFQPRIKGLEYHVHDGKNEFFILTNWKAENFRIMRTALDKPDLSNWQDFAAYNPNLLTSDMIVLHDRVIADVYEGGLNFLTSIDRKDPRTQFAIRPSNPLSAISIDVHRQTYRAKALRFSQESLTEPGRLVTYDLTTHKTTSIPEEHVPNFDPSVYESQRDWATVRDGTRIPLTILKKKSQKFDGTSPALVIGYGAYGTIDELSFSHEVFSLIDRGFIVVHAHIRGGGLMGRQWYFQGRKEHKINTFYDFIDSTEYLIKAKIADPKRIFAMGSSAGGLLMGAITNMRPDLYRGIVADVPFVDVLTTMLDDSIPLTTGEYEEWGNPNIKSDYDLMAVYSPYDNIKAQNYPHILAIAGLNDGQVGYWEPAKWVSKLRDYNTSGSTIMLKTNMTAGHQGPSGRFGPMKDLSAVYAFLLQN